MSQAQETAEELLVEPTFVARVLRDNEVFSNWIIGLLEGCEGCTDEAAAWVEGQTVLRDAHHNMEASKEAGS